MTTPEVLHWRSDELQSLLERIAAPLRGGRLVALPTEAGMEVVASALNPEAVAEITELVGPEQQLALVLSEANEVFDWLPQLRGAGLRLARAFWPGPLTLVSAAGAAHGLATALPAAVRTRLLNLGRLAVRLPDQHWPAPLRRHLSEPLLTAPLPGEPRSVEQIHAGRELLALALDDGPSPFAGPPSVVRTEGKSMTIVREGAVPRADLESVAPCRILFLCTGNTCRSPLAEALCKALLSDKLGCAADDLPRHGYVVQSAGLAAGPGNPATPEAAATARDYNADLRGHRSRPASLELLSQADLVFTMTWSHLNVLRGLRVAVGPTPVLLDPTGADIDDPIGGRDEVYRACAAQIWLCLNERLPQLLEV